MEKEIKIKTKDNYLIHGVLNTSHRKTEKLIIFVHGLTGHKNEHIFYNAKNFFTKREFSTFRFNLYSGEKKGRILTNIAISVHAQDVSTVIGFFKKKYKHIYLVGHSLGGPSILFTNTNSIQAIVLWDASSDTKLIAKEAKYMNNIGKYLISDGVEFLIGKEMYKELMGYDNKKSLEKTKVPLKMIISDYDELKSDRQAYKYANTPKELKKIKGAGHCFDEEGTEKKLFEETLSWFKKY